MKEKVGDKHLGLPPFIHKIFYKYLKKIVKEKEINDLIQSNNDKKNYDFVTGFFEGLNFIYNVKNKSNQKIPKTGRLFIISNHPLGGLDGLALLNAVSEVRQDVKIIVNDILMIIENLQEVFIPTATFSDKISKSNIQKILDAIYREEAIIIFPAGSVSHLTMKGIRDAEWNKSFVSLAKKYSVPIIPTFVKGRNSFKFYIFGLIKKTLGTLLLPNEIIHKENKSVDIYFGNTFHVDKSQKKLSDIEIVKLVKELVYSLPNKIK